MFPEPSSTSGVQLLVKIWLFVAVEEGVLLLQASKLMAIKAVKQYRRVMGCSDNSTVL